MLFLYLKYSTKLGKYKTSNQILNISNKRIDNSNVFFFT